MQVPLTLYKYDLTNVEEKVNTKNPKQTNKKTNKQRTESREQKI